MKSRIILLMLFLVSITAVQAQKPDTVIISIAKTSKIIFTIQDRRDIEVLKHYNFQDLFEDVLKKLEKNDTTDLVNNRNDNSESPEASTPSKDDSTVVADATDETRTQDADRDDDGDMDDDRDDDYDRYRRNRDNDNNNDNNNDNDRDWDVHFGSRRWGRTWQSFNFDLGTNNYLQDGKFPGSEDLHSVRPWGSWYLGFSSVQSTRVAKKLFLQWSLGMNWYNFKFENDDVRIIKTDDGVIFEHDDRDANFIKSKLTASYINAALIPMLDFGDNGRKHRFWEDSNSFRIGVGPYVGYRVGSHTKQVYNDGGREKDKDRDSLHLNNFRYGARLQLGYRSTDLFFNYDVSELFVNDKGPKLNAFSFGVIF
jgi:Skp family chaperone for outer membrane proteins